MIFLIDCKGTLDSGSRQGWQRLIARMKAAGHAVCIATSGNFSSREQQQCGFDADDFDRIYAHVYKDLDMMKQVRQDFRADQDEICLIDNEPLIVKVMALTGHNSIHHQTLDKTEAQLIKKGLLPE